MASLLFRTRVSSSPSFFFFVKIVLGRVYAQKKDIRMERASKQASKRKKNTAIQRRPRNRFERWTTYAGIRIEHRGKTFVIARASMRTHARASSLFSSLSLYSSSNGERVKGEEERREKKRQKERRKRSNSSSSNGGKQATKRTLSLYFVLDEKIEQQG